ncbi:MAG: CinA family protein [Candidatus Gastranaerophilales bacterium]|nr:CinA family protein [Candidatus Gastranaerophilales bacterium]
MKKEKLLYRIKEILTKNKLSLSSAESCTGGLISSYLTDISGSSEFIFQNFVTYSNDAKTRFLGVKKETLEDYGAVSEQTAYEMSLGLLKYADCSIATTGILGPTGGSEFKPVGLVYISFGYKDKIKVIRYISKKAKTKNRYKIKQDIVEYALIEFYKFLKNTLY